MKLCGRECKVLNILIVRLVFLQWFNFLDECITDEGINNILQVQSS